jgi:hypothetical protein
MKEQSLKDLDLTSEDLVAFFELHANEFVGLPNSFTERGPLVMYFLLCKGIDIGIELEDDEIYIASSCIDRKLQPWEKAFIIAYNEEYGEYRRVTGAQALTLFRKVL